jgi:hypothetical protein
MKVNFYWHPYKYFPYEQEFAVRELKTLLGQQPIQREDCLSVENLSGWKSYAQRMTYFREVVSDDGSRVIPLQTVLEVSTIGSGQLTLFDVEELQEIDGNADVLSNHVYPSLSRQSTRYSAHGLHEYRGKFNPQIVRAIGNMLGLHPGYWILDPFGGSGTTLLEATHLGWNAVSIDINPLGVVIAQAKIAAMRVPVGDLLSYKKELSKKLNERFNNIRFDRAFTEREVHSICGENWQDHLPGFEYLTSWFTTSVLVQLAAILDEIMQIPSEEIQLIFRVILSDILREVSLQDPNDLRIRRRKLPSENMPAIRLFVDALETKIETVVKARRYIPTVAARQEAILGDSRYCTSIIKAHPNLSNLPLFDGVITSPPYATALPYIDTQRLSLILLGLIKPEEIRVMEKSLTGNREITTQKRSRLEEAIDTNAGHLPDECIQLCRRLKEVVDKEKDGFRRQNVPALLYQYLTDMSLMFKNTHPLLKTGTPFALVVGQNQTTLGGQRFIIDTPHLLILLAQSNGFTLQESLKLDTYQRYDIHQDNSIRSETLVILRKAEHAD